MTKLLKQDLVIFFCLLLLCGISILAVFSTTFYFGPEVTVNFQKQLIYLFIGLISYLFLTTRSSTWLANPFLMAAIYCATIAGLVYLLVAAPEIAGTRRWIDFGIFSLQPAEFAKLTVILTTALILGSRRRLTVTPPSKLHTAHRASIMHTIRNNRWWWLVVAAITAVLPIIFLIYRQRSLGNTVITGALFGMTLLSLVATSRSLIGIVPLLLTALNATSNLLGTAIGISLEQNLLASLILGGVIFTGIVLFQPSLRRLALAVAIIGLVTGLAANYAWEHGIAPYQRERIVAFLDPESDPQGSGWQVARAKIAIAAAPIPFGFGFLRGPQVSSQYLPYPYTDFIFAASVEQFGLLGALVIILIYALLLMRIIKLVGEVASPRHKLILIGIASLILLNMAINIGMNIGIMPVTGVPLPLISYGGSSVLVNMVALGIVQMIYTEEDLSQNNVARVRLR